MCAYVFFACMYLYIYVCVYVLVCEQWSPLWYGVASINRLLKIVGLFCKRALQKRLYSAKETYHFKEPTNCSHPIGNLVITVRWFSQ